MHFLCQKRQMWIRWQKFSPACSMSPEICHRTKTRWKKENISNISNSRDSIWSIGWCVCVYCVCVYIVLECGWHLVWCSSENWSCHFYRCATHFSVLQFSLQLAYIYNNIIYTILVCILFNTHHCYAQKNEREFLSFSIKLSVMASEQI